MGLETSKSWKKIYRHEAVAGTFREPMINRNVLAQLPLLHVVEVARADQ